ncbi:MAG TPA: hypothetical protein VFJ25_04580 [Casimicrobiaceae bacterium]|nr:hypothetical protein [Casimicrobiaceae bacterium]
MKFSALKDLAVSAFERWLGTSGKDEAGKLVDHLEAAVDAKIDKLKGELLEAIDSRLNTTRAPK